MSEPRERLEQLARREAPGILAFFARRVQTRHEAEELLSETFVALSTRPSRIPVNDVAARMWAFGVARRVLLSHWRKSARGAIAVNDWFLDELEAVEDPDESNLWEVRAAISELSPRQREIVMLVHWDGFSLAEAAENLGMSSSTARTHYERAKATLRLTLEEHSPSV